MNLVIQQHHDLQHAVDAKQLYTELGLDKSNWAKWSQRNITNNEFALEYADYVGFVQTTNGNSTQNFLLSIPFAKKLAMQVKTQKGEDVRNYFLDCEQKAQQVQQPQLADLSNPVFLRDLLLNYTEQNIALTNENKVLNAAIENITNTGEGVKFQQACKTLSIKQAELAKWLRDNKWDRWINKSRASTHYSQERGYCMTKYEEKDGVKASGEPYNYTSIEFFILPKGMAKLAKVFGEKAA